MGLMGELVPDCCLGHGSSSRVSGSCGDGGGRIPEVSCREEEETNDYNHAHSALKREANTSSRSSLLNYKSFAGARCVGENGAA